MKQIPLGHGRFTLVDDEDCWRCLQSSWYLYTDSNGHISVRSQIKRRMWLMHRWLLGDPEGLVDHRDNDSLNNQKYNLRVTNHSGNARNRRAQRSSSTNYKGVSKHGNNFRALIWVDQKLKQLGTYTTQEEAALKYDAEARIVFGEFARLNFPAEGEQKA